MNRDHFRATITRHTEAGDLIALERATRRYSWRLLAEIIRRGVGRIATWMAMLPLSRQRRG